MGRTRNEYSRPLLAKLREAQENYGIRSNTRFVPASSLIKKCRTRLLPSLQQVVLATCDIKANQAVSEVQGKYKLMEEVTENGITPEMSFFFHYKIPGTDIEVCVDSRSAKNYSKFIRRSRIPNAEVRHFIRDSSLHLYVVARTGIRKNAEIIIAPYESILDIPEPGVPHPSLWPRLLEITTPSYMRTKRSMRFRMRVPRGRTMAKVAQLPFLEDSAAEGVDNDDGVEDSDNGDGDSDNGFEDSDSGVEDSDNEDEDNDDGVHEATKTDPAASTVGNSEKNEEGGLSTLTQNKCFSTPVPEALADDVLSEEDVQRLKMLPMVCCSGHSSRYG